MADLSEDDKNILEAFHALTVKPKITKPEDLISFMKHMGETLKEDPEGKGEIMDPNAMMGQGAIPKVGTQHNYPRISIFYGDDSNKGEVSWPTFKFEVEALVKGGLYTDQQILMGIRRSVKGPASDVLRRLGTDVTVKEVIRKLNNTFGSIETPEVTLRKFFACQQEPKESVSTYASRVEDMFERATMVDALHKDDDILKKVFYQGLKTEIKYLAFSKCDLIHDYDKFKIKVKKIEADLSSPPKEEKQKCNAVLNTDKKEKSELSEVKELLQQINQRVDKLEKEKEQKEQPRQVYYDGYQAAQSYGRGYQGTRGPYRGRGGNRGRGRGENRGRGNYHPSRPTGTNTMQPTCYNCSQKGHIARNCPN